MKKLTVFLALLLCLACSRSAHSQSVVYDFANCPGLSGTTGWGNLTVSKDDQTYSVHNSTIIAVYSKKYNKCYWLNDEGGLIGGTDNPTPVAASLPWPGPVTLGNITAVTGTGSVPSGTYYVVETVLTDCTRVPNPNSGCSNTYETAEQTTPGSATLSATGEIQVAPESGGNLLYTYVGKGCNIYVGTSASGPFYKQLTDQVCSNTLTVSSYSTSGSTAPSNSTAGYALHDGNLNASGQYEGSVPDLGQNFNLFWQVYDSNGNETTTTNMCQATSGNCLGNISFGYSSAVYIESNPSSGGVPAHYDLGKVPLSAPTTQIHLIPSGPPYYNPFSYPECNVTDTHTNWTGVNSADTAPVIITSFVDGTNSPYSLMQIHCAFDHEIDAVATDGSGSVWRLAHNRASGLQNALASLDSSYNALSMPVCSSDGKYCLFATDWSDSTGHGQLGTQTGEISGGFYCQGLFGCAWQPSTSYGHYQEVIDSNGNEEMVTVAGTSASGSHPAWPTTIGGTVRDGTVTWQMGAGCNTSQTTSSKGTCRTDVFLLEIKPGYFGGNP